MTVRKDGRAPDEIRDVTIERGFIEHAEGSCLIKMGNTWVVTTATVEDKVAGWLKGSGQGWVTAEYAMIPRATVDRVSRESVTGRQKGRSMEIQRLIGRSLRAVVDLYKLGEVTITIDCDVIKADGGTRTASVTGGFVALYDALQYLVEVGRLENVPILDFVAAVSVGIVDGECLLDLTFEEDFDASVDMNVVMTAGGKLVEVQGTAEKDLFGRDELIAMLDLAEKGIQELIAAQKLALGILEG